MVRFVQRCSFQYEQLWIQQKRRSSAEALSMGQCKVCCHDRGICDRITIDSRDSSTFDCIHPSGTDPNNSDIERGNDIHGDVGGGSTAEPDPTDRLAANQSRLGAYFVVAANQRVGPNTFD